jgi:poly(beta-D-mannuronate) lyase
MALAFLTIQKENAGAYTSPKIALGYYRYMRIKIICQLGMIVITIIGMTPLVKALGSASTVTDVPKGSTHTSSKSVTKKSTNQPPKKAVTPPPKPAAPPPVPSVPADTPSSVLDLTNWKLALPVDTPHAGTPDEITQPELATFSLNPYFWRSGGGIVFRAHAGGATTKNSRYPRSELREMAGGGSQPASWSNAQGVHTMTIRQAITHVPDNKPHVVAGQIHDASDDVIMIRLEGSRLFVEGDGDDLGLLDANYTLGTVFTVQVIARDGHIQIHYNGELKVDYAQSGSGYYFKAGCYTQSNPSKGDAPGAYGEVVIYSLQVSHS